MACVYLQNNAKRPYVMAEQAAALEEQYNNLQQFAVMELGVPVLAVRDQSEAAQLLAQMVHSQGLYLPSFFSCLCCCVCVCVHLVG